MSLEPAPVQPSKFVLTGPTGWIGRAMLDLLHRESDPDALAAADRLTLFGSRSGSINTSSGKQLQFAPLAKITPKDLDGAHVIHLAFLTKDRLETMEEAQFLAANRAIDECLIDAMSEAQPASIFVASSGAARAAQFGEDCDAYSHAKLEQEKRFIDLAERREIPCICGRIFNIAGPHINKLDKYALSDFIVQALTTGSISIRARIPVFRSFLHVEDLCRIVLRAARQGVRRTRPIDLCGTELLEMNDIARHIVETLGGSIRIERSNVDYSKSSDYVGTSQETLSIAMQLSVSLQRVQEQIQDTVDWVRSCEVAQTGSARQLA